MLTFDTVEDDGMMGLFLNIFDSSCNGFKDGVLVKSQSIEFVFVAAHGLLETTGSAGLVNFDYLFVWVNLKEWTDIVGFGEEETVEAGSQTEILLLKV